MSEDRELFVYDGDGESIFMLDPRELDSEIPDCPRNRWTERREHYKNRHGKDKE